ncbi:MAG: histidinol-phosphatase HisJ family protein [Spirochaetes bacterium]|nr:histidinol-phosphatase HisJ family protein [Spirochaetota bacterium]
MVDYHTHTYLCGHASGTVEEYIESALKKGIREIGFSDHAPMPDDIRADITMSASEVEPYIGEIKHNRDIYSGRIAVKLGFEVDFPLMGSFDERYFTDPRIDYLIGSCHFIDGWAFDHPDHVGGYSDRNIDDIYTRYYAILEALASSGLFNMVGHFDIVKKFGYRSTRNFLPAVEKIARIMAAHDLAAEINTAGLLHKAREIYPSEDIIRIFFNCNVPITLGSDAHRPEQTGYMFQDAIEILSRAGYRKLSGFSGRKRYDIPL